jgi:hypothetical protein
MATYDWTGTDVIPNGSGSAVRADINDALLALFSQNSSATAPPETVAYMPWADTSTGLYKIRNGANSGWITLYQLDGEWTTIALENGTAAAPSLYFKDSGTDTGIYSSGTDAVDIATAGVRRVGVSSSGDVTIYAQGDLRFADSDSSNWVAFQAPATVTSNVTWTLPATDGTADQALATNGSGVLSWASRSQMTLATSVASTSGTSIDFTGIPNWVKRVTVMFNGVSTSGTSEFRLQLGNGSFVTSGYATSVCRLGAAGNFYVQSASGAAFQLTNTMLAADVQYGQLFIANITGNTWALSGGLGSLTVNGQCISTGALALSGTLDRIRITTVNGTDTFDAGSINIIYEG